MRTLTRDYQQWVALGPGGLPHNLLGWSAVSFLRLVTRETRSTGIYDGSRHPDGGARTVSRWDPPARVGSPPPIGRHPIPHRQLDQIPDDGFKHRAGELLRAVAGSAPEDFTMARSHFEGHVDALQARRPADCAPWLREARGEIGHVHPSDGSLHVVVDPADAGALIRAGWSERHPLCGVPFLGLPMTYLLMYAPRDEAELAVTEMAVRRAAAWALPRR